MRVKNYRSLGDDAFGGAIPLNRLVLKRGIVALTHGNAFRMTEIYEEKLRNHVGFHTRNLAIKGRILPSIFASHKLINQTAVLWLVRHCLKN